MLNGFAKTQKLCFENSIKLLQVYVIKNFKVFFSYFYLTVLTFINYCKHIIGYSSFVI